MLFYNSYRFIGIKKLFLWGTTILAQFLSIVYEPIKLKFLWYTSLMAWSSFYCSCFLLLYLLKQVQKNFPLEQFFGILFLTILKALLSFLPISLDNKNWNHISFFKVIKLHVCCNLLITCYQSFYQRWTESLMFHFI